MKENFKKAVIMASKCVFSAALAILIFDVNSACTCLAYQPKLPAGSEKFKRA
ncbi:MAG: cyclic lactone autoinducer peptide [Clostridia bacterium]|nr:cyclic lactone autoinducer peptide [Clostridia bacterium]